MSLQTLPCLYVPLQYYVLIYVSADLTSCLCSAAVLCIDLHLYRPYLTFMICCNTMYRIMSLQTLPHIYVLLQYYVQIYVSADLTSYLCSSAVLSTDLFFCRPYLTLMFVLLQYHVLIYVSADLTSHLCSTAVLCTDLCLCRPYIKFIILCSSSMY